MRISTTARRPLRLLSLMVLPLTIPFGIMPAAPAVAQPPPQDENWPCIQRKVPQLQPGQVWTGPPVDEALRQWRDDREVARLVGQLAARRTPMEEAQATIAAFAEAAGADKNERLTLLFAGLFQRLNNERGRIVGGIERYAENQRALSEAIKETREELAERHAEEGGVPRRSGSVATPRRDGVDATPEDLQDNLRFASDLDEKLYWDTRIYDERHRALTYVCDSPVIIEQRLFALGRAIQQQLD